RSSRSRPRPRSRSPCTSTWSTAGRSRPPRKRPAAPPRPPKSASGRLRNWLFDGNALHRQLEDVSKGPLFLLGEGGNRGGRLSQPLGDLAPHPLTLLRQDDQLHAAVALGSFATDELTLLEAVDDAGDVRVVAEEKVGELAHLAGTSTQDPEGDHLL